VLLAWPAFQIFLASEGEVPFLLIFHSFVVLLFRGGTQASHPHGYGGTHLDSYCPDLVFCGVCHNKSLEMWWRDGAPGRLLCCWPGQPSRSSWSLRVTSCVFLFSLV
jgi:hypothetical protein